MQKKKKMSLKTFVKRKFVYYYSKIMKEKASPEYIARGWAIGMFYGCLIPFGLQLIFSIPTSFLLKGSKIGATVGTLLTNHFTIFLIYPLQCYVGSRILGAGLTYEKVDEMMQDLLHRQEYSALFDLGGQLLASFFIGGLLLTIIMTPLTYFLILSAVRRYRILKEEARKRKMERGKKIPHRHHFFSAAEREKQEDPSLSTVQDNSVSK